MGKEVASSGLAVASMVGDATACICDRQQKTRYAALRAGFGEAEGQNLVVIGGFEPPTSAL
jgi:hypothetical protein